MNVRFGGPNDVAAIWNSVKKTSGTHKAPT
jgi:hypothetical protein